MTSTSLRIFTTALSGTHTLVILEHQLNNTSAFDALSKLNIVKHQNKLPKLMQQGFTVSKKNFSNKERHFSSPSFLSNTDDIYTRLKLKELDYTVPP